MNKIKIFMIGTIVITTGIIGYISLNKDTPEVTTTGNPVVEQYESETETLMDHLQSIKKVKLAGTITKDTYSIKHPYFTEEVKLKNIWFYHKDELEDYETLTALYDYPAFENLIEMDVEVKVATEKQVQEVTYTPSFNFHITTKLDIGDKKKHPTALSEENTRKIVIDSGVVDHVAYVDSNYSTPLEKPTSTMKIKGPAEEGDLFRISLPAGVEWIKEKYKGRKIGQFNVIAVTDQNMEIEIIEGFNSSKTIPLFFKVDGAVGEVKIGINPMESSVLGAYDTFAIINKKEEVGVVGQIVDSIETEGDISINSLVKDHMLFVPTTSSDGKSLSGKVYGYLTDDSIELIKQAGSLYLIGDEPGQYFEVKVDVK